MVIVVFAPPSVDPAQLPAHLDELLANAPLIAPEAEVAGPEVVMG